MIKGLSSSFIENFSSTTIDVEEGEEFADAGEGVEGEVDGEGVEGEGVEEEVDGEEGFQNSRVIEPFSEGTKIQYGKHKLLLKSILAGILFYLLSSPQVYKLTKPYLKNIDAVIIHSLLFVAIHFFLNIVFN